MIFEMATRCFIPAVKLETVDLHHSQLVEANGEWRVRLERYSPTVHRITSRDCGAQIGPVQSGERKRRALATVIWTGNPR